MEPTSIILLCHLAFLLVQFLVTISGLSKSFIKLGFLITNFLVMPIILVINFIFTTISVSIHTSISNVFRLISTEYWNIEFGLNVSFQGSIIYFIMFVSAFIVLIFRYPNIMLKSIEPLVPILFSTIILLIFSPNFVQLFLCTIILDIVFTAMIQYQIASLSSSIQPSQASNDSHLVAKLPFFLFLGDSLIFGSIIMLLAKVTFNTKVHIFSFEVIQNLLRKQFLLNDAYFNIIGMLFVLGIIIKVGALPLTSHYPEIRGVLVENPIYFAEFLMVNSSFLIITPITLLYPYITTFFAVIVGILIIYSLITTFFETTVSQMIYAFNSIIMGEILITLAYSAKQSALQLIFLYPFSLAFIGELLNRAKDEPKERENEENTFKAAVIRGLSYIVFLLPSVALVLFLTGIYPFNPISIIFSPVFTQQDPLLYFLFSVIILANGLNLVLFLRNTNILRPSAIKAEDTFKFYAFAAVITTLSILLSPHISSINLFKEDSLKLDKWTAYINLIFIVVNLLLVASLYGISKLYNRYYAIKKPSVTVILERMKLKAITNIVIFSIVYSITIKFYDKVILAIFEWLREEVLQNILVFKVYRTIISIFSLISRWLEKKVKLIASYTAMILREVSIWVRRSTILSDNLHYSIFLTILATIIIVIVVLLSG